MAVTRHTGSQKDALESAVDLTGKEFFLATIDGNGRVNLAGAGGRVVGVINEGKKVGLHSSFHTGNQLKAVAGAAINEGDKLASDAAGKVKVAAGGQFVFGTAKSAAANGELVEFYMDQEGAQAA
jgi:hypothetical protein